MDAAINMQGSSGGEKAIMQTKEDMQLQIAMGTQVTLQIVGKDIHITN
jgi:hypothetical protein